MLKAKRKTDIKEYKCLIILNTYFQEQLQYLRETYHGIKQGSKFSINMLFLVYYIIELRLVFYTEVTGSTAVI